MMESPAPCLERATFQTKSVLISLLSDYLVELASLEGVVVQRDEGSYARYIWYDDYWGEPERIPFILKIADEIVGFCFLRDTGECWQVAEFSVLPSYRRKGIGARAVEELKAFCRADGRYRYLGASTHSWNPRGLLFWRSQGFVTVGEIEGLLINVWDLSA